MQNLRIEDLSTEQKLGMLLCARRFEESDIEEIIEMIKNHSLGCLQLSPFNEEINKRILAEADYPILVFNDTERKFQTSGLPSIPALALAATDNPEYYHSFARGVSCFAKEAGFTGTWGPIIDILPGDGPCAVARTFSDTPEGVVKVTQEIAKVFKQNHYLSTGKHYPGSPKRKEGEIGIDSHMTSRKSEMTVDDILNYTILPYLSLKEKGLLPCVMVGHQQCPNIDPDGYPASLSKKTIDVLRNAGYDGLIFTDSFAMMAILQQFGEENIYGMAINAGNDIVLPNYRTSVKDCYNFLKKNYENGAFTEERLNDAVRHVLEAMEFVGQTPENPSPFTEQDRINLDNVARDCITAITDEGVDAKLPENNERLFVVMTEVPGATDIDGPEVDLGSWYNPETIIEKIKAEFPEATVQTISEYSNSVENERLCVAATKHKEVVFVTFCTTTSYLGTDCMTRRAETIINAIVNSGKVSTIVHFGNPFALKKIQHIPRKILGYTIPESQVYAIDVLKGNVEAKGKLPIDVKFQ